MRGLGTALAASLLLAWACSLPNDTPTEPDPTSSAAPTPTPAANPNPTPTPVLGAPAPRATPTPEPTAEPSPEPTPDPGGSGEGAAECGQPLPPALSTIKVKVHLRLENAWVLDSTPLVGPDAAYCAKIGFTDGRSMCPVRPEGNPEREACELYVTGRAVDTGRPGPTWRLDGRLCQGPASGCENHPDNQYLLVAYRAGTYQACSQGGVCGEVDVN
jgi:hypothetical protein